MTDVAARPSPRRLARRLVPLQVGVGLQGLMLWVPVEKLFQTSIGFDAASIGVMAAAYAAVVPLLEVPSGILADRWSRNGIMVLSSAALAASSLLGGMSTDVAMYVVAAMILGVYFALNSGTVDSVVYDVVLEETGSSDLYETWIGRVRIVESAALVGSALVGGVLAGWTSPRLTYFATVPFALVSVVAFVRFDEPRLHRAAEPVALRRHVATTFGAMTSIPQVRRVMLLAALTALLSQAVFEFGPLWLVALQAPAAAFGPYWAALVATFGLGGYLTSKLRLDRVRPVLALAAALAATPVLLATSSSVVAVVVAQTALQLVLAIIGPRRAAAPRRGAVHHPGRGVLRRRDPVVGAVPALLAGVRLARPRPRRAVGRLGARRRRRCPRAAVRRLHPGPAPAGSDGCARYLLQISTVVDLLERLDADPPGRPTAQVADADP